MNTPSTFNPDTFLSTQYSDQLETRRQPVPEGEYAAVIDDVKLREVNFRNGGKGIGIDVFCRIEGDATVKEATGQDTAILRYSFLMDVKDDGSLDFSKGKNLRLGRLRAAVGQNTAGRPWSFNDLKGNPLKVRVKHRADDNDTSIVYDEVSAVSSLS